jgi:hypothetical protein
MVQFRALGDARSETDIENLLRGLEFTDALLEEGDLLPEIGAAQDHHPHGPLSAALGRRHRRARADALHRLQCSS